MIVYGFAFLVFLLGLAFIAMAYLSAHRTIIPAIRQAVYLWWPGLGLMVFALLIALSPSILRYTQCQNACAVTDGRTPEYAFADGVSAAYENCVKNGLGEVKRNVFERMKDGATGLDPEKAAAEAEPGIREVCEDMVVGQCVAVCYDPQPGEIEGQPATAAR